MGSPSTTLLSRVHTRSFVNHNPPLLCQYWHIHDIRLRVFPHVRIVLTRVCMCVRAANLSMGAFRAGHVLFDDARAHASASVVAVRCGAVAQAQYLALGCACFLLNNPRKTFMYFLASPCFRSSCIGGSAAAPANCHRQRTTENFRISFCLFGRAFEDGSYSSGGGVTSITSNSGRGSDIGLDATAEREREAAFTYKSWANFGSCQHG